MIRKIIDANPIDYTSAISANKVGITSNLNIGDYQPFNSGAFVNLNNKEMISWGLGAGMTVSGGGPQTIFDKANYGAALSEFTLVNKGTGVVYLSFNGTGYNLNNSMPLEYNESYAGEFNTDRIWANCPSGNTVLIGIGNVNPWKGGVNL